MSRMNHSTTRHWSSKHPLFCKHNLRAKAHSFVSLVNACSANFRVPVPLSVFFHLFLFLFFFLASRSLSLQERSSGRPHNESRTTPPFLLRVNKRFHCNDETSPPPPPPFLLVNKRSPCLARTCSRELGARAPPQPRLLRARAACAPVHPAAPCVRFVFGINLASCV
jgi:hypothetical protein